MTTLTDKQIFFDDQDILDLDIDEIYSNYIKEIDSFRSYFNATNGLLDNLVNQSQIDSLISQTNIATNTVQESRCHAFFRLLGLPVIDVDGDQLYNSGFDKTVNANTELLSQNFKIANGVLKSSLKKTLNFRENRPAQITNIFSPQDINSTAAAIVSQFVRDFNFYQNTNQDRSVISQSYSIKTREYVGKNLKDENNNSPTVNFSSPGNNFGLSQHIIHPLIVDPRIDLTVIPATKRVCAPFLQDKSQTQLRVNSYLPRPYLEQVITIRSNISNQKFSTGDYVNSIITFINDGNDLQDTSILDDIQILKNKGNQYQVLILDKLFKILRAVMKKLFNSINDLQQISQDINFFPIPNISGTEFGGTLRDTTSGLTYGDKKIENDIRNAIRQKAIDEVNFSIGLNSPSVGNFAFSGTNDIIFGSFLNVSKFYDKQISDLTSKRSHDGDIGIDALKTIEIITGEISGLGLVDILCIICALWLIDTKYLINMLDQNALQRLKTFTQLQSQEVLDKLAGTEIAPSDVLIEFENKVAEIYNLAQKFFNDAKITNS